jgi:hypothetical protein
VIDLAETTLPGAKECACLVEEREVGLRAHALALRRMSSSRSCTPNIAA